MSAGVLRGIRAGRDGRREPGAPGGPRADRKPPPLGACRRDMASRRTRRGAAAQDRFHGRRPLEARRYRELTGPGLLAGLKVWVEGFFPEAAGVRRGVSDKEILFGWRRLPGSRLGLSPSQLARHLADRLAATSGDHSRNHATPPQDGKFEASGRRPRYSRGHCTPASWVAAVWVGSILSGRVPSCPGRSPIAGRRSAARDRPSGGSSVLPSCGPRRSRHMPGRGRYRRPGDRYPRL